GGGRRGLDLERPGERGLPVEQDLGDVRGGAEVDLDPLWIAERRRPAGAGVAVDRGGGRGAGVLGGGRGGRLALRDQGIGGGRGAGQPGDRDRAGDRDGGDCGGQQPARAAGDGADGHGFSRVGLLSPPLDRNVTA